MLSSPVSDHVKALRCCRGRRALAAVALAAAALAAEPAAAEAPPAVEQRLDAARAPVSELEPDATRRSLGTRFHRFDQEVGGVAVLDAEVVVGDAPGREGDLLVDSTRRDVAAPPSFRVDRGRAVGRALSAAGLDLPRGSPDAELAILPDGRGGTLVWRVLLSSAAPPRDLEVLVDARSGAVVRERDLTHAAKGRGRIFAPNALVHHVFLGRDAEDLTNSPGGIEDGNSETLTDLRVPVTLRRLDSGQECLVGTYAHARTPSGEACRDSRDFESVKRGSDRFEAVMAYFYLDATQGYIRALGFSGAGDRRTRVDVNTISDDNSFYQPLTQRITLGAGGVDDGEDGDVVLHEYGHAVQDDQVPFFGLSTESKAMAEGFADYTAAAIADFIPNGTEESDECMFEWDARGYSPPRDCSRDADTNRTAAQALGPPCHGQPHCAGGAWSSVLLDLRAQLGSDGLGRRIMDVLTIQSHFYLTASASFDDAAEALLAADEALYGGAHETELRDLLAERGFLKP